eukprot:364803-Chlamydomonas_euryale.AAC.4
MPRGLLGGGADAAGASVVPGGGFLLRWEWQSAAAAEACDSLFPSGLAQQLQTRRCNTRVRPVGVAYPGFVDSPVRAVYVRMSEMALFGLGSIPIQTSAGMAGEREREKENGKLGSGPKSSHR